MPGPVGWFREWSQPRPGDPTIVRCIRRLVAADARDRVLILAGQAFIAVVPLTIVVATLGTSMDGDAIANYVVSRFSLSGDVARSVHALFARPPEAVGGVSIASVVVLLFSVNSFSRSVRRTAELAWQLPRQKGVVGARDGFLGVAVALLMTALLGGLNVAAGDSTTLRWLVVVPQLVVGYLGWVLAQWYFVSRRVPRAALIPGAIVGAIVQLGAGRVSGAYMPHLIARNSERYGVIGVSFSLVTWLVIAAAVLVCVAIVGAELGRKRFARTEEIPVEITRTQ